MKKSRATNVFNKGLIMDLNPLVTPNDVMTDCLNGTLITYNGNENSLQNDMGNARVETAYLPEGYVPLGTAELGGVIYIVSYNPLSKMCQIGSFPSPERNITSDEVTKKTISLKDEDFSWNDENGALIYNLKSSFGEDLIFNPGDKFIIYGDVSGIANNLYDESKYGSDLQAAQQQTIRFRLAAQLESGKLIYFDSLKKYTFTVEKEVEKTEGDETVIGEVNETYSSVIYNCTDVEKPIEDTEIDGYRELISQPYNVYSSKAAGKLVLISELVQFSEFDVEVKHTFEGSDTTKKYNPEFTFTMTNTDYKFVPKGVHIEASLTSLEEMTVTNENRTEEKTKKVSDSCNYDFLNDELKSSKDFNTFEITSAVLSYLTKIDNILDTEAQAEYFNPKKKRARDKGYILTLTITPYMNWGMLTYLQRELVIDIDKINTGFIDVTTWKYYKQPDSMRLVWGLDCYPEAGWWVDKVTMDFFHSDDLSASSDKSFSNSKHTTYEISGRESYHAIFSNTFKLDERDEQIKPDPLKSNSLYLVKITAYYCNEKDRKDKNSYRWMYTNGVFNTDFSNNTDFNTLKLSFNLEARLNNVVTKDTSETDKREGTLSTQKKDGVDPPTQKASLSVTQTDYTFDSSGVLSVNLKEDYDSFYFVHDKDDFTITSSGIVANTAGAFVGDSKNVKEDSYEVVDNEDSYAAYKVTNVGDLTKLPDNVVLWNKSLFSSEFQEDKMTYNITYKPQMLLSIKGDCSFEEKARTFSGTLKPLAYDDETFGRYNLKRIATVYKDKGEEPIGEEIIYDDTGKKALGRIYTYVTTTYYQWVPKQMGLFSFHENDGNPGQIALSWVSSSSDKEALSAATIGRLCRTIYTVGNLQLHWTTRSEIITKELSDFENTAVFVFHLGGENGSALQCANKNGVYKWFSHPFQLSNEGDWTNCHPGLFLFMKSDDSDCYYPISFVNLLHMTYSATQTLEGIKTKYKEFTNTFAQVLNNLYHYDTNSATIPFWLPKDISYVNSRKNGIELNMKIEQNKEFNNENIKIGDKKLSEIASVVGTAIDCSNLKTENISALSTEKSITISREDKTSGLDIYGVFEAAKQYNSGTAIYDHDGVTLFGPPDYYTRYDKHRLYCPYKPEGAKDEDQFLISSTNFKLRRCRYYSTGTIKESVYWSAPTTTSSAIEAEAYTETAVFVKEPPSYDKPVWTTDETGSGGQGTTTENTEYIIDWSVSPTVEWCTGEALNKTGDTNLIDLNDRFSVNDDGLLVVIPKGSSEFNMKTKSNDDSGTSSGYQRAYLVDQYDMFSKVLNNNDSTTDTDPDWVPKTTSK